jgi:hypothetical protein
MSTFREICFAHLGTITSLEKSLSKTQVPPSVFTETAKLIYSASECRPYRVMFDLVKAAESIARAGELYAAHGSEYGPSVDLLGTYFDAARLGVRQAAARDVYLTEHKEARP